MFLRWEEEFVPKKIKMFALMRLNLIRKKIPDIMSQTGKIFPNIRPLQTSRVLNHSNDLAHLPDTINVTFICKDGEEVKVKAKDGERALYLAHRYDIEMEGACEASLACTTCHCYVESTNKDGEDLFHMLPEATEEEEDLLDMAPFLQENSRLGCQIILKPELDGIKLRLPRATKNFYVDGHKPTPH